MPITPPRPGAFPPADPTVASVSRYDAQGRILSWHHPDLTAVAYLGPARSHPVPEPPGAGGPDPDEPFINGG